MIRCKRSIRGAKPVRTYSVRAPDYTEFASTAFA
jgi:hypothetical protein